MSTDSQLLDSSIIRLGFDFVIQVVLIGLGLILALWYESRADPKLTLEVAETRHNVYPDNRGTVRFTYVKVRNAGPSKLPFIGRRTAQSTFGYIRFRALDGTPLHSRVMPIRWSGQPEPVKFEVVNNSIKQLLDPSLIRVSRYMDIPPNEEEVIDVAFRREGHSDAYGWSHENYQQGKWEHPEFTIPPGQYQVEITVTTGDRKFRKTFLLNNPANFNEFELHEWTT